MFTKKIKKTIKVEGMHCEKCSSRIKESLKAIPDIIKVNVNLNNKEVEIISKKEIEENLIKDNIEKLGYKVI